MLTRVRTSLAGCIVAMAAAYVVAENLDRGVVAYRAGDGVYVGWRLLADDPADAAFHVYRQQGDADPVRLTAEPVRTSTNYLDGKPLGARDLRYIVRAVQENREGPPAAASPHAEAPDDGSFIRVPLQGRYVAQKVGIGDLDGDGRYDYVIKQPDFNVDPYEAPGYWKKSEDTYKLEAYRSDGTFLWRHDMGWSIEEGIWYSPYVVYDLDGDGKAEVYVKGGEGDPRDADGRVQTGPEWLLKLDGQTGKVLRKLPWPDRTGYERYNYYCRNMLGIAWLDGRRPHLIVQRGTYTLIKVEAYTPQLELAWKWDSTKETRKYAGQGMHGMHAADIDADGKDELIIGSAALDDDGRGLWSRETGHPDACYVGDIDPARPGLEIFFGIEPRQKRDAVCLVDARTGEKIWGCEEPSVHVHSQGMAADVTAAHPGQECYAGEKDGNRYWLYSAAGKRIGDRKIGGLAPRAAWWDADPQKELLIDGIRKYEGPVLAPLGGGVIAIADVLGDWREEVLTSRPGELRIYTTVIPCDTRRVCLMQDRLYRNDVAVASMGYFSPPQTSK